jgi:hypothetical protein
MVEWVQPKEYSRWRFPASDLLNGEKGKKEKGGVRTANPPVEKKPTKKTGIPEPRKKIERSPERKEIGPGRTPIPMPGRGPRTVEEEEAGRQARAELVASVMRQRGQVVPAGYSDRRNRGGEDWRAKAGLNTGAIHTGQLVEEAASTRGIRAIEPPSHAARTQELPRQSDTRALPVSPYAHDSTAEVPSIRRGAIEQMALFDVPRHVGEGNLAAAQTTRQERQATVPASPPPSRQIASLSAYPTPGKLPGDQGVLFRPRRYH